MPLHRKLGVAARWLVMAMARALEHLSAQLQRGRRSMRSLLSPMPMLHRSADAVPGGAAERLAPVMHEPRVGPSAVLRGNGPLRAPCRDCVLRSQAQIRISSEPRAQDGCGVKRSCRVPSRGADGSKRRSVSMTRCGRPAACSAERLSCRGSGGSSAKRHGAEPRSALVLAAALGAAAAG